MRKRFWMGSIICLFAICSVFTFMALAHQHVECKGPQICAGAQIKSGSRIRAWARVSSPCSVDGRWGYKVRAGNNQSGPKRKVYYGGCSKSWEVGSYTADATADAENAGRAADGKVYFASKSASSGG